MENYDNYFIPRRRVEFEIDNRIHIGSYHTIQRKHDSFIKHKNEYTVCYNSSLLVEEFDDYSDYDGEFVCHTHYENKDYKHFSIKFQNLIIYEFGITNDYFFRINFDDINKLTSIINKYFEWLSIAEKNNVIICKQIPSFIIDVDIDKAGKSILRFSFVTYLINNKIEYFLEITVGKFKNNNDIKIVPIYLDSNELLSLFKDISDENINKILLFYNNRNNIIKLFI